MQYKYLTIPIYVGMTKENLVKKVILETAKYRFDKINANSGQIFLIIYFQKKNPRIRIKQTILNTQVKETSLENRRLEYLKNF